MSPYDGPVAWVVIVISVSCLLVVLAALACGFGEDPSAPDTQEKP